MTDAAVEEDWTDTLTHFLIAAVLLAIGLWYVAIILVITMSEHDAASCDTVRQGYNYGHPGTKTKPGYGGP